MEDITPQEPVAPIEPTEPAIEITPVVAAEPVEPAQPAWDWPTLSQPATEPPPPDDPGLLDEIRQGATQGAVDSVRGIMQQQAELRNQLARMNANEEVTTLAEYTLLSMNPAMAAQPGAARMAASLAIGSLNLENKSWQRPRVTTPPTAQPVGNPNPTYTAPETDAAMKDFDAAFAGTGISSKDLENA